MKAILLTYDNHRSFTHHTLLTYQRIWPSNRLIFQVPYQTQNKDFTNFPSNKICYVQTPISIKSTVLKLIKDLDDDEWVYWCLADRYLINVVQKKLNYFFDWINNTDLKEICGLSFVSTNSILPKNYLQNESIVSPDKTLFIRRKDWKGIWNPQFIRTKLLRYLFSNFPDRKFKAIEMDAFIQDIPLPEKWKRYISSESFAIVGESTRRDKEITLNCYESFQKYNVIVPAHLKVYPTRLIRGQARSKLKNNIDKLPNRRPPVYFYVNEEHLFSHNIDKNCLSFDGFDTGDGINAWILRTYLHLREKNFFCTLISQIPEEGIIIAHRRSLPYNIKPNKNQLLVCCKGDKNPHPFAQVNIIQNPFDLNKSLHIYSSKGDTRYSLLGKKIFLPHWPEIKIKKRNKNRDNIFQNIAYFGLPCNLADEFKKDFFKRKIRELGLKFKIISKQDDWADYSNIDAIIAVRGFGGKKYQWKPASKLYNAWLAGVPAILGAESSYKAERKSELDYIEVNSIAEVIQSLKKLKENPDFRKKMIENGYKRAKDITCEKTLDKWIYFIEHEAIPEYYIWQQKSNIRRKLFFLMRILASKIITIKKYKFNKSA